MNYETKPIAYIGMPYSHPDPLVMEDRYVISNEVTAFLFNNAPFLAPFAPISYTHRFGHRVDKDYDWVANLDINYLRISKILIVITIDGWKESKGLQEEIQFAKENNIPIVYSLPEELIEKIPEIHALLKNKSKYSETEVTTLVDKIKTERGNLQGLHSAYNTIADIGYPIVDTIELGDMIKDQKDVIITLCENLIKELRKPII